MHKLVHIRTGFVQESGEATGRPWVSRSTSGAPLLVAYDVGNTIWRVTAGG